MLQAEGPVATWSVRADIFQVRCNLKGPCERLNGRAPINCRDVAMKRLLIGALSMFGTAMGVMVGLALPMLAMANFGG